MALLTRWARTLTAAAAVSLFVAAATSTSAGQLPAGELRDRQGQEALQGVVASVGYGDVIMRHEVALARWSAIDARIETLVADMHMFTGELKVVAMDALLTAVVERQSDMRAEMRLMHGGQTPQMMERSCGMPTSPSDAR